MTRHIAIYLTNPAVDASGTSHPDYAVMLENMLAPHMPNCRFTHYDVVNGDFPANPGGFDGVVITGSVAYVTDPDPWIATLFDHIRQMDQSGTRLFAVCFGHQAVAMALGGQVAFRDIVLGAPRMEVLEESAWMDPPVPSLRLFAGNFQQVTALPSSMKVTGTHPDCAIAMARKDDHIMTIQFHPEFEADYVHSYIDDVTADAAPGFAAACHKEVDAGSDGRIFGRWAAAFLLNTSMMS